MTKNPFHDKTPMEQGNIDFNKIYNELFSFVENSDLVRLRKEVIDNGKTYIRKERMFILRGALISTLNDLIYVCAVGLIAYATTRYNLDTVYMFFEYMFFVFLCGVMLLTLFYEYGSNSIRNYNMELFIRLRIYHENIHNELSNEFNSILKETSEKSKSYVKNLKGHISNLER